jgi:hypothetical protein
VATLKQASDKVRVGQVIPGQIRGMRHNRDDNVWPVARNGLLACRGLSVLPQQGGEQMHLARAEAIGLCLMKIIAFRARGT